MDIDNNQWKIFSEVEYQEKHNILNSQVRVQVHQKLIRTSDGGNGNPSVSLPIILIKVKVDQMLPSSYIGSMLVSIL